MRQTVSAKASETCSPPDACRSLEWLRPSTKNVERTVPSLTRTKRLASTHLKPHVMNPTMLSVSRDGRSAALWLHSSERLLPDVSHHPPPPPPLRPSPPSSLSPPGSLSYVRQPRLIPAVIFFFVFTAPITSRFPPPCQDFSAYLAFSGIVLHNAQLYETSQLENRRNQVGGS